MAAIERMFTALFQFEQVSVMNMTLACCFRHCLLVWRCGRICIMFCTYWDFLVLDLYPLFTQSWWFFCRTVKTAVVDDKNIVSKDHLTASRRLHPSATRLTPLSGRVTFLNTQPSIFIAQLIRSTNHSQGDPFSSSIWTKSPISKSSNGWPLLMRLYHGPWSTPLTGRLDPWTTMGNFLLSQCAPHT